MRPARLFMLQNRVLGAAESVFPKSNEKYEKLR